MGLGPSWPTPAQAIDQQEIQRQIDRLVEHGGFYVSRDQGMLTSRNPDQLLVPASTWKIATALAALRALGPDFRFETRFYLDAKDNLYIQGFGDPYLISEEISTIVKRLSERVARIDDILLDASAFQLSAAADGTGSTRNPYDAVNGALVANFNTINITVSPAGHVRSAEPQTPTLPMMQELGEGLKPGSHRLNICGNPENVLRHVGELFRAFQVRSGIAGQGHIKAGRVPAGLRPVYVHRSSRDLSEIVQGLMLYSNNFIANQLFLTYGAQGAGYPATWKKARRRLQNFLQREIGLDSQTVQVEEGSGLSRRNLITPRAMAKLLAAFRPYAHLLPLEHGRLIKSGTLTGVYAYAGYFPEGKNLDSFVLILNQDKNQRDRLLDLLEDLYRNPDLMIRHAQAE